MPVVRCCPCWSQLKTFEPAPATCPCPPPRHQNAAGRMRRTWRPPARVRRAPPPRKLAPAAWASARNLGKFMRKAQQTAASPPPPACPTGLYPYLGACRGSPDVPYREFCLPVLSARERAQMRALCPFPCRSATSSSPPRPAGCLHPRCPSASNRWSSSHAIGPPPV